MKLSALWSAFAFGLVAWVAAVPTASALTVYTDGSFDPADYSVQTTGSGTATSTQILAGGNPAEYLLIQNRPTPSPGQFVGAWHLNSTFVYSPAASGAISAIDWTVDLRNLTTGQYVALGIEQDGVF